MIENVRWSLLKHIDQIGFDNIHAQCIEVFLRSIQIDTKPLSEINDKSIKEANKKLKDKNVLTLFTNIDKETSKTLILSFLTNLVMYSLPSLNKQILDTYKSMISTYLKRSVASHLSDENIGQFNDLVDLIISFLFKQNDSVDNFPLKKVWVSTEKEDLINRIAECIVFILEGYVSKSVTIVNINHSNFALVLKTIESQLGGIKSSIQAYYKLVYSLYLLNEKLSLPKITKAELKEISTFACQKVNKFAKV